MEEWEIRRKIYYANKSDYSDSWENMEPNIVYRNDAEEIVEDAILYITQQRDKLYYPGKSHAIAILYAYWLSIAFGGLTITYLNADDLLFDDPHFSPYSKNEKVYNCILEKIDLTLTIDPPKDLIDLSLTRNYFLQEFLLDEDGKKLLS